MIRAGGARSAVTVANGNEAGGKPAPAEKTDRGQM